MKLRKSTSLVALGVLAPVAVAGGPGTVTTLFTNIATSSTSDVPGLPGTKFTTGTSITIFDRPFVSPNGAHWVIRGDTPLATTADAVVLYDGTLLVQEGTATPFAAGQS